MAISRLKLRSADEEILEVEEEVGFESQTIRSMVEDNGKDTTIPLLKVSSKILTKVIEYCTYHVHARGGSAAGASGSASGGGDEAKVPEESVKAWDTEFVKVDMITLCDLVLAANYLNIKSLLDLTGQTVANIIKTMTPEEIRKTFNIKNDFTPEEEEEVRRENQWAFE